MNNEKPYIEHNGTKYEFEASFTLKRQFDKETKEEYRKIMIDNNINENEIKKIQELQKFVEENQDLNIESLDEEMTSKLLSIQEVVMKLNINHLYEKYCYLMLRAKYDISITEWEEILEGLAEDYGFDFIDKFTQKVCEKVFMKKEEKKEKKTLPSWMN